MVAVNCKSNSTDGVWVRKRCTTPCVDATLRVKLLTGHA